MTFFLADTIIKLAVLYLINSLGDVIQVIVTVRGSVLRALGTRAMKHQIECTLPRTVTGLLYTPLSVNFEKRIKFLQ